MPHRIGAPVEEFAQRDKAMRRRALLGEKPRQGIGVQIPLLAGQPPWPAQINYCLHENR